MDKLNTRRPTHPDREEVVRVTKARAWLLIKRYLIEIEGEGPLYLGALVGDDGVDEPGITLRDCVTRLRQAGAEAEVELEAAARWPLKE